jgi:acetoin utilization protein AcuC
MSLPYTIGGINRLPAVEKCRIYGDLIPDALLDGLGIPRSFVDAEGHSLLHCKCAPDIPSVEMSLYHKAGFPDPVLYGHLADTLTGQVHVLLYILNDPSSERFDVDRMPDGSPTQFGTLKRNLEAEQAALEAGLAPGQIRRGLRLLTPAIQAFERFIQELGHDLYFVEPLYYHNAVIFERYGFAYQQGRKLMERIHSGFSDGGDLMRKLEAGSAFRRKEAESSIRLRSWAIHDGILGEPYTNVTMYKRVGKHAGASTTGNVTW